MPDSIRDLTTTTITTAWEDTPIAKVAEAFSTGGFTHMPVLGGKQGARSVVGMISTTDLLREFLGGRYDPQRVASRVMSKRVESITLDATPREAADKLLTLNLNCLVVEDGQGHFRGILTSRDLLRGLAGR